MRLKNKVAIITGASSGLGKAIAEMYLKEGAQVVLSDINPYSDNLPDEARFFKADTSKKEEVEALVEFTIKEFGSLDIIVNNAGIGSLEEIAEMSDETWEKVISINLNGVFYGLRAAAAYMKEKKIKGSIINMASILGQVGFSGAGAYCASKGGVNQLTRTASMELAPHAIRVNSIAPGFIKTSMTKDIQEDKESNSYIEANTPLGHMGEPNDIAYAAVYLASDESKYVTGSVLYVDGGWTAR
jgi:meso-butanediol dehydrogenase/(S,S)-butanediol dehydrogenase/diacetyl reductase